MRSIYTLVTGEYPPRGFGVHSCRYLVVSLMTRRSRNLASAQSWLQHRSIKQTGIYLRHDHVQLRETFDRITRASMRNVRDLARITRIGETIDDAAPTLD